jgi:hypothetical protein
MSQPTLYRCLVIVVELATVNPEELDAVVGSGIMARAHHHPKGGAHLPGVERHRADRHDSEIDGIEPGGVETGVDGRSEHLARSAGVPAHHGQTAATVTSGAGQPYRDIGGEVDIGNAPDAVRAE